MKKGLTIFVILLIIFTASYFVIAEDYVLKVNDYVLTVEEYDNRVENIKGDSSKSKKRDTVFSNFIEEVILRELIKEKELEVTEEDIYQLVKKAESFITSGMNDTYPLGHFNDIDHPKEEIIERIVSFDETNVTYQEFERNIEMRAIREKVYEYYEKKAKKQFENGDIDETLRNKYEEIKETQIQKYENMDEEQKEEYSDNIQEIKDTTFEDFKEYNKKELIIDQRDKLFNEAMNKKGEELDIQVNKENSGQKAIINATKNNEINKVKSLLKEGIDPNTKNIDGNTALFYAANNNSQKIAELLIENGADVDAENNKGVTPLNGCKVQ
ncbi:MAG: ankyrin repeat domain-containing protein [Halanaerobiales bacterium]|nr:ankyrin repeat domain-containing protein [Halanaerobiales bacterium]